MSSNRHTVIWTTTDHRLLSGERYGKNTPPKLVSRVVRDALDMFSAFRWFRDSYHARGIFLFFTCIPLTKGCRRLVPEVEAQGKFLKPGFISRAGCLGRPY